MQSSLIKYLKSTIECHSNVYTCNVLDLTSNVSDEDVKRFIGKKNLASV